MAISIAARVGRRNDRAFYGSMALLMAAIVFAGFSRTFYLAGHFHGPALSIFRVVHGSLFSAWFLLFITQTLLVAAGRTDIHRRLGVGGVVLAAAMVVAGTIMAIISAREGHAPPDMDARSFLIIPLTDMAVFASLVASAVYFRKKPETHKRLMLLATISLVGAAVARLPTTLTEYGPLFFFGALDLLLLFGPVYDLVTRRKVNPAYIWGGLGIVTSQVVRLALSRTGVWLAVADLLTGH